MGFKRKRCDASSPVSISSNIPSTPDTQSPSYLNDVEMGLSAPAAPQSFSFNLSSWPKVKSGWDAIDTEMGSRTRKRFRDNRPDEKLVHETTIFKLFEAQRAHPHASPIPSSMAPPTTNRTEVVPHPPSTQKSTLHSFWKISTQPAPPVQVPIFAQPGQHPPGSPSDALRCEECDSPLHSVEDGMDVDMDASGSVAGNEHACRDCGKSVCAGCAVVGDWRCCLECATAGVGRRRERWW